MPDFPQAAANILRIIRTEADHFAGLGERMPIYGADLEACAEAAVAAMFIDLTRSDEEVNVITVRTAKILGAKGDRHQTEIKARTLLWRRVSDVTLLATVTVPGGGSRWRGELIEQVIVRAGVYGMEGDIIGGPGLKHFRVDPITSPGGSPEPLRRWQEGARA